MKLQLQVVQMSIEVLFESVLLLLYGFLENNRVSRIIKVCIGSLCNKEQSGL